MFPHDAEDGVTGNQLEERNSKRTEVCVQTWDLWKCKRHDIGPSRVSREEDDMGERAEGSVTSHIPPKSQWNNCKNCRDEREELYVHRTLDNGTQLWGCRRKPDTTAEKKQDTSASTPDTEDRSQPKRHQSGKSQEQMRRDSINLSRKAHSMSSQRDTEAARGSTSVGSASNASRGLNTRGRAPNASNTTARGTSAPNATGRTTSPDPFEDFFGEHLDALKETTQELNAILGRRRS
jgi:hypothetical protein